MQGVLEPEPRLGSSPRDDEPEGGTGAAAGVGVATGSTAGSTTGSTVGPTAGSVADPPPTPPPPPRGNDKASTVPYHCVELLDASFWTILRTMDLPPPAKL
jgi:hypothetical protein